VTVAPRVSVVIPAFDEAHRLPPYLHEVVGFLESRGEPWEVIVVDDGSTDGTAAVVREVAEHSRACGCFRSAVTAARGRSVPACWRRAAPSGFPPTPTAPRRSPSSSAWKRRWDPAPTSSSARGPCGFELFTGAAAEPLFETLETSGFAFDVELLLRAQKAGYHVVEGGVNWADQERSRVGVLTTGPGMLLESARARWRVRRK
jgi:dolichyl-phosphate beta-glucosyltransferase